jgi:hypothetical protein
MDDLVNAAIGGGDGVREDSAAVMLRVPDCVDETLLDTEVNVAVELAVTCGDDCWVVTLDEVGIIDVISVDDVNGQTNWKE